MPAGPNYLDSNGFLRPGEDSLFSPVSDWLDPFVEQFSDAVGGLQTAVGNVQRMLVAKATLAPSAAANEKTVAVTFAQPFSVAPTVVMDGCKITAGVAIFGAVESITTTGFTIRVKRLDGSTFTGGYTFSYIALGTS